MTGWRSMVAPVEQGPDAPPGYLPPPPDASGQPGAEPAWKAMVTPVPGGGPMQVPDSRGVGAAIPKMATAFTPATSFKDSMAGGALYGVSEIIPNALQFAAHGAADLLPQGMLQRGAQGAADWLDKNQAENEQTYNQDWRGGQPPAVDVGRTGGNIAGALALAPESATIAGGKIAQAINAGGMSSIIAALTGGGDPSNFWRSKLNQAEIGMGSGIAGQQIGNAIGRVVSPKASTNPNVQTLLNADLNITPGQALGGRAKSVEDMSTSIPWVGGNIAGAQREATLGLNKAVANRVLAPIGEAVPEGMEPGRQMVQFVQQKATAAYHDLLPGMRVTADAPFMQEVSALRDHVNAGAVPETIADQFNKILDNQVMTRFAPKGSVPTSGGQAIDGETMKKMDSELGRLASNYIHSADGNQRELGTAIRTLQDSLRDAVTRSNPDKAAALKAANEAWGNLAVFERATGMQGATEGVFSPQQFSSAVKASDKSIRDRQYAAGNARMQDLSDAARAILPSSIPSSGTSERGAHLGTLGMLAAGAGELGLAGHLSPEVMAMGAALGAGGLGSAAAYSDTGRKIINALVARRPDAATGFADAIRAASPYASLGIVRALLPAAGGP